LSKIDFSPDTEALLALAKAWKFSYDLIGRGLLTLKKEKGIVTAFPLVVGRAELCCPSGPKKSDAVIEFDSITKNS
jgi:hypothetical protein